MPVIFHLTPSAEDHPGAGGRTRIISEARFALGNQYRIVIVCLVPLLKFLHPIRLMQARRALQADAKARVVYWPSLPSFGNRRLDRLLEYVRALSVLLLAKPFRVSAIHAQGLGAATTALACRWCGFKGAISFDVHGASVEEHTYRTGDSDGAWVPELEARERAALNGADLVIYVSQRMYEHYEKKYGITPPNWVLVPCATSAELPPDAALRSRLRRELNLDDRFVFIYSGSYRKYQLVDEMIRLFIRIKQQVPDAFFLILTSHLADFQACANKHSLRPGDYRLLSVNRDEVLEVTQAGDVGFLLRADSVVNRVASPTKFAEYCICGVPSLITSFVGDYSREVAAFDLGCVVDEFEVTPDLLHFIAQVRSARDVYAARCHDYARSHLTWDQAGRLLREAYTGILNPERSQAVLTLQ